MKVINQSFEIQGNIDGNEILKSIERAGRTCYKSEERITDDSAQRFVKMIIKSGHDSVIEHEKITVRIICDRGVSHEIVRHRIASYSQESTRYCNYTGDKFGNELTFIKPSFWKEESNNYKAWKNTMSYIEKQYFLLIENGAKPEEARSILPNSLKTEIMVTMNMRSWRNFLILRTAKSAHPQIREIAIPMLKMFQNIIPIIFDDISY
jgi:thymidylate synthase (FAD)